jgi:hypothetical protein
MFKQKDLLASSKPSASHGQCQQKVEARAARKMSRLTCSFVEELAAQNGRSRFHGCDAARAPFSVNFTVSVVGRTQTQATLTTVCPQIFNAIANLRSNTSRYRQPADHRALFDRTTLREPASFDVSWIIGSLEPTPRTFFGSKDTRS